MEREDCEYCDGEGQVCTECNESAGMCDCDDDENHDDCRDCNGMGFTEVETCTKCKAVVDNCNCEDE